MFIDVACKQLKKYNQNAYGDYFLSKRYPDTGRLIAVLSDGLGSGIKANILSCMTATMLLKFVEGQVNIKKAAEIIMNSLPVCKVRKISYSTFSAIDCDDDGNVKIVEEGNPQFIWIRDGNVQNIKAVEVVSKNFKNRVLMTYKFVAKQGDRIIFCSDGVTQTGLGSSKLPLGLEREGLIKALKVMLDENPTVSSSELSREIVLMAKNIENDRKPKDDVSASVIYFREPREALVFTGPPYHQEKDYQYAEMFSEFIGKKAICGGTTANLISRELGLPIETERTISIGNLPACSNMKGVDLVTEGILTLTKSAEYLESGFGDADNAAVKLVNFLLDSDCIKFMVGAKLNQAHYDPSLPIEIEIRKNIIKKIANLLETKFFKKVDILYM